MSKYDSNYIKQLRNLIQNAKEVNLVLGAGDVWYGENWIPTNIEEIDVACEEDWEFIVGKRKIDRVLCEHVWEHLSDRDTGLANVCVHRALKAGGNFRLAVPDGRKPDSEYINNVKPGGIGAGSDDHKVLYTYEIMKKRLERCGFSVDLLEYWNEDGEFIYKEWSEESGFISRSKLNDDRNKDGVLRYTSIIVDAIK